MHPLPLARFRLHLRCSCTYLLCCRSYSRNSHSCHWRNSFRTWRLFLILSRGWAIARLRACFTNSHWMPRIRRIPYWPQKGLLFKVGHLRMVLEVARRLIWWLWKSFDGRDVLMERAEVRKTGLLLRLRKTPNLVVHEKTQADLFESLEHFIGEATAQRTKARNRHVLFLSAVSRFGLLVQTCFAYVAGGHWQAFLGFRILLFVFLGFSFRRPTSSVLLRWQCSWLLSRSSCQYWLGAANLFGKETTFDCLLRLLSCFPLYLI